MKKIFFILMAVVLSTQSTFAALINRTDIRPQEEPKQTKQDTGSSEGGMFDGVTDIFFMGLKWVIIAVLIFFFLVVLKKITSLIFEIYYTKNLRYLKITLPRADSKLDKEHETKKDFKEKVGMMTLFYKAIHKLSEAGLKDTFLNALFGHSKISLELVYENGEVDFYMVTYKSYVSLITQHITSIYNDAEVLIVEKKDYIKLKQPGYHLRGASLGKEHDDVFPIKTYKSLEDDPLNNLTNVFGGLDREDKAVFQMVIKPEPSKWNKKAKKAASLVAK